MTNLVPRWQQLVLWLIVPLLLCQLPAFAASTFEAPPEPPFQAFSTVDGLTQAEATDVAEDAAGHLWVTTRRGLNRYDGRSFDHLTIANGLPTNHLTAVAPGDNGTVWVGDAKGGISLIRGDHVIASIAAVSGEEAPITDLVFAKGVAYVGTGSSGLVRMDYDGRVLRRMQLQAEETPIRDLSIQDDWLWFVSDHGLHKLSLSRSEPAILVSQEVGHSHFSPVGVHWVIDRARRLGVFGDTGFMSTQVIEGAGNISDLVSTSDNELWVASEDAITGFLKRSTANGKFEIVEKTYSEINDASVLFIDREQTLWIGTPNRLIRYLGDRFVHRRFQGVVDSRTIWSIGRDANGYLYFGTEFDLLRMDNTNTVQVIGEEHGIPAGAVRDVIAGADNEMWVGVRGQGVYRLDTELVHATLVPGTENMEVLDLALEAQRNLWIATAASGVHRYDTHTQSLSRIPDSDASSVYSLAIEPGGTLWYGLDEVGVVRVENSTSAEPHQTILGRQYGLNNYNFNHLRLTGPGELWIGTENGGLFRLTGDKVENLGPRTPLRDQSVYLIEPLDDGTIVVGGEQGLYQIDPETLHSFHYGPITGFLGMETNAHASFQSRGEGLWLGTIEGATLMDTTRGLPALKPLAPQIVRVETQQRQLPVEKGAELGWGDRGLMTEFVAVSLLEAAQIEYSYRLRGLDDTWGAPTTNQTVNFAGLGPGNYVFEVRARYPGGDWSDQIAATDFRVLAPFWRTVWFAAMVLVAVGLAVFMFTHVRTLQVERTNKRLRQEVLDRTRSIESARSRLELSNQQLSTEIAERRKADAARKEVETRFHQAFEHTPIGMGMLSTECELLDANPSLRRMLWPDLAANDPCGSFMDRIVDASQPDFDRLHQKLITGAKNSVEAEFHCTDTNDRTLQVVITLAAVRDLSGQIIYSVLQVLDVTEQRLLTDKLEYQANYDELTGLLNRRSFEDALERAYKNGSDRRHVSYLMFMDLDQFKIVNDTSGHGAGDELLRQISDLLRENVRTDDAVGRLGGDEFGLVLWECPDNVAARIAESIRAAIEAYQFQWDAETYRIGISIGAVPIDPDLGNIAELQQLADAACYEAKEAGRNRVHIVQGEEPTLQEHRGEARWVQRLREAMDTNRFALYGQLIKPIRGNSKEPERMEVLLRMRDPVTRKLIPPGAFLPAAERYGLSVKLDEWVVRSLLDMLFVHNAFGASDRRYWVNLSGTSIGDPRFAEFLIDAMKNSPLPKGMINFEITETAVIRSVGEAGKLMKSLRGMGCKFALDDFGSGLSSFGYLKKLPVDYLKIDGMFIRDILVDETDRIFVKSIIDIAHTMGMKTITEFVENDAILAVVADLGADYVQGFGVHRPEMLAPQFPGTELRNHLVNTGTDIMHTLVKEQEQAL